MLELNFRADEMTATEMACAQRLAEKYSVIDEVSFILDRAAEASRPEDRDALMRILIARPVSEVHRLALRALKAAVPRTVAALGEANADEGFGGEGSAPPIAPPSADFDFADTIPLPGGGA